MPEFNVRFRVSGYIDHFITADSEEEAQEKVNKLISEDGREYSELMHELDEVDDASASISQLFRVKRADGKIVKTTYVRDTDQLLPDAPFLEPKVSSDDAH